MRTLFVGLGLILAVLYFSLGNDYSVYLHWHTLLLVVGGTAALLFFVTPTTVFKIVYRAFRLLINKEDSFSEYKNEFVQLARNPYQKKKSKNPLIAYAQELWEQGVDANLFTALLSQRRMELENETIDAVQTLKNLAKYPPALGMIGTVIAMIAMFSNLDANRSHIGANLAFAMTATFFGLVLTNTFLSPIADRMQVRHVNRKRLLKNIYQILILIHQGEPATLITDQVETKFG